MDIAGTSILQGTENVWSLGFKRVYTKPSCCYFIDLILVILDQLYFIPVLIGTTASNSCSVIFEFTLSLDKLLSVKSVQVQLLINPNSMLAVMYVVEW